MFRYTATFLLIFLVLNHEFAAARKADFVPEALDAQMKRSDALEDKLESNATGIVVPHSREKRGPVGHFIRLGLRITAGGSFLFSTGSTIYHAIQKCKDYRPSTRKSPNCKYLRSCPDVNRGPQHNREYVKKEKEEVKAKLSLMDRIRRDAFNLATKAINAASENRRIMVEIERIYQEVDKLVFSIARLDVKLATSVRDNAIVIGSLLRNESLSLDDIVASPEIVGIFDKWTWEGTGFFILSIAIPITLQAVQYFQKRYAINKIVKSELAGISKQYRARLTQGGSDTINFNKRIRATAKEIYKAKQTSGKVSRFDRITTNYLAPLVNAIVTALSIWTSYSQISNCKAVANDMQSTAIEMAEQSDRIEKIKQEQVDPLLRDVKTKVWPRIQKLMTNDTTVQWLERIRNLTLDAVTADRKAADVIQNFIDKAPSASYDEFITLQEKLIESLKSVKYVYACFARKQNAISTIIVECKQGLQSFKKLYKLAVDKHNLNAADCVVKDVPYTNEAQVEKIVKAFASHQQWFANCQLNNNLLRDRVCSEKDNGYHTPTQIIKQVGEADLTTDMVKNFLSRCPPPKITPKKKRDTCRLYCLYQSVSSIAKTVHLLDTQVEAIEKTCGICLVDAAKVKKICSLHKCKGEEASTIEKDVRLPLPTVQHIMANTCTKCNVDDPELKKSICFNSKCKGYTVEKLANVAAVSESAVKGVLQECGTIVPSCLDLIPEYSKRRIYEMDCFDLQAQQVASFLGWTLHVVQQVLKDYKGKDCPPFSRRKKSRG